MAKEHEIDILDVDKSEVESRLRKLGAKYKGHTRFKRIEFVVGGDIRKRHSWVRVRTDGNRTVITFKHFKGRDHPMEEHEVTVDSFADAVRIMSRLARSKVLYFENERDSYELRGAKITIDKWPRIPHFVEVESRSMAHAKGIYRRLAIGGEYVGNAPIDSIYKRYGLDFRKVVSANDPKLKKIIG